MNRFQVGSPGYNDLFVHQKTLKGVCVADDLIIKTVTIGNNGDVVPDEFIEGTNELYCIDGHQDSGRVVFAGEGNQAFTSNMDNLNSSQVFCEYLGKVWDIALDQVGVRACLVGDDKNPILFDFNLNKKLSFEAQVPCGLISCCWSPDSSHFAVVGKNGQLTLLSVDQAFTEIKLVHQWKIAERDFKEECLHGFNPAFIDEKTLITAGKECLQTITKKADGWSYSISSKIKHQAQIYQVAVLRDSFVATVGHDKKLSIWNLGVELKLRTFDINYKVSRIRFVSSQDLLLIADDQGQIFSVTNPIKAAEIPVASVEEDTKMTVESKKETFQEEAKSEIDGVKLENRMDEEKKAEERRKTIDDENSNYQFEEEKTNGNNQASYRNKQLVYDEADEVDMRRKAGLLEDMESRYGSKSIQKVYRPRREENPPQPAFISGSTTGTGEGRARRHFLCYNMYGKVLARQLNDKKGLVEAEFSVANLSRHSIINDRGFDMASINYRGILLASQGEIEKEDEYADEEKDENEKLSTLRFISVDFKNNWEISFGPHENIECIALGVHWAAAKTNKGLIRIFNPSGTEDHLFAFGRPIVGLAIYENLLAILYHDGAPFSGRQIIRLQFKNLSNREVVEDREIPISPDSRLRWYGFSDEGIFFVQDTKFMLFCQQTASTWVPVFDGAKEANMWVIGVSDQTIVYLKLPYGEYEPSVLINYTPSNTGFRPPFMKEDSKPRFLALLKLDQARLRVSYFGNMRASAAYEDVNHDPTAFVRQSIPSEEDLDKQALEVDRITIDHARKALLKGEHEAAIYYGLQLESPKALDICLRMFESLGQPKIAERLKIESDKIGNVQFLYRQTATKRYIPQLVVQAPGAETEILIKESTSLLTFNSIKLNKSSFADVLEDKQPGTKVKASESSKEEEKPKKKPATSHDLFRDFADMGKSKR